MIPVADFCHENIHRVTRQGRKTETRRPEKPEDRLFLSKRLNYEAKNDFKAEKNVIICLLDFVVYCGTQVLKHCLTPSPGTD